MRWTKTAIFCSFGVSTGPVLKPGGQRPPSENLVLCRPEKMIFFQVTICQIPACPGCQTLVCLESPLVPVEKKPRKRGRTSGSGPPTSCSPFMHPIARRNVAIYCLMNSRRKTANCSGRITAFLGFIASVFLGTRAKEVQRGPLRARIFQGDLRGYRTSSDGGQEKKCAENRPYALVQKYASWRWYFAKSSQPRQ